MTLTYRKEEKKMKKGLSSAIALVLGVGVGAYATGKIKDIDIKEEHERVDKFKNYYTMLNQWLILKQEDLSLETYFVERGYEKIAIYGMGEMGNRLYDELKTSSIKVECAIDSNASATYSEVEVYDKDDDYPEVDVVVVTATFAFSEIKEELESKVSCDIVSLDDVVFGV